MNDLPLVSVLMTAYNRQEYIAEAIESVLHSTYSNFELIIVDDCSSDNTVSIARGFEMNDARVMVHVNEKNLGDYPNRNRAASYAKGMYIKYLDSDDYFLPEGLNYCFETLLKNPTVDWAIYNPDEGNDGLVLQPDESVFYHFFNKPILNHGPGGFIMKRSFFLNIGMFPEKYGPANDMYFNLKAAAGGKMVLMTKPFMYYRIHSGQEINNQFSYLYNNYNYMKDVLAEIDMPLNKNKINWLLKKNKRRFTVNIIKFFIKTFDVKKTRFALKQTQFTLKDALQGIFH